MEDRPRQNKKRKREKHHKSQNKKENSSQVNVTHQPKQASSALPNPTKSKGSTFLDKMRARLSGGHFRMINEKLYTCRFFFLLIP
jgi:ribosomal RNA-processing protein 8